MKRMMKSETDEVKKIVQQAKIQMNTTSAKMVSEITNMLKTAEVLIDTEESQIISQINKNPRLIDGKSTRIDIKTVPALIQIRSIYEIWKDHIKHIKRIPKLTVVWIFVYFKAGRSKMPITTEINLIAQK